MVLFRETTVNKLVYSLSQGIHSTSVRLHGCFIFTAHFHHLLNEGIPMPLQIGAQLPFLIITYAGIGMYFTINPLPHVDL